MSQPKLLSGEEIVDKGATKASASLPEIGLKDVTPNGSWLEQKQIQSALDARKLLIEVPRIEKFGTLSHAVWREDLRLAEVTKQTGGYWQFLGHHSGKILYLNPEEALYLMEVNCLLLKYNEVTVSLQQAYSLLLRDQVSIMQYKVYASLSRLGYKVFRFSEPKTGSKTDTNCSQIDNITNTAKANDVTIDLIETAVYSENKDMNVDKNTTLIMASDNTMNPNCSEQIKTVESDSVQNKKDNTIDASETQENMDVDEKSAQNMSSDDANKVTESNNKQNEVQPDLDKTENVNINNDNKSQTIAVNSEVNERHNISETGVEEDNTKNLDDKAMEIDGQDVHHERITESNCIIKQDDDDVEAGEIHNFENCSTNVQTNIKTKKGIQRSHSAKNLLKRHHRSQSAKDFHKYFENIPDLLQKVTVTVAVPTEHLPDRVSPKNASYQINLNNVRTKKVNSPEPETNTYNVSNRTEFRFQSSVSTHQNYNNQTYFYSNIRFQRQPVFNQFHFWRPRPSWNSFPYNVFFQRPFIRNTFFAPRFHFFPRQAAYVRPSNLENSNNNTANVTMNDHSSVTCSRKRARDNEKLLRLNTIKKLASKLKSRRYQFGIEIQKYNNIELISFVQNLIKVYNERYQTLIRLTDDFDIEENEHIVETITLDDDEVATKKPRHEDISEYEENFTKIQQLASKIKDLDDKDLATPRHRRALSSVVKTFNDSFNADIYINESYDVLDRRYIILDSSSDSDCIIKETEVKKDRKKVSVGKKVRNPFNLLKCISEKNKSVASCSKDIEEISSEDNEELTKVYTEHFKRMFKCWLPKSNDFGRAEIVPKKLMLSRIVEANKQTFLYDFIKNQNCKFINWLDVKISFLENMEYAATLFHDEHVMDNSSDWNSIIKPEDCKDMPSVLNKLSIIPNINDVNEESSLKIDFDVYNRDVHNFKKRNMPTPHFRIVCVKQSSGLPPGPDVSALHARYEEVPIVFAVVGEAISYLQINPINLPMYIPEGEPA